MHQNDNDDLPAGNLLIAEGRGARDPLLIRAYDGKVRAEARGGRKWLIAL